MQRKAIRILQIPQWVPFSKKDVALDIHPKSSNKIKYHRAAKSDEGSVDKVQPDFAGSNIEFIAQIRTYSKSIHFNEPPYLIHS